MAYRNRVGDCKGSKIEMNSRPVEVYNTDGLVNRLREARACDKTVRSRGAKTPNHGDDCRRRLGVLQNKRNAHEADANRDTYRTELQMWPFHRISGMRTSCILL